VRMPSFSSSPDVAGSYSSTMLLNKSWLSVFFIEPWLQSIVKLSISLTTFSQKRRQEQARVHSRKLLIKHSLSWASSHAASANTEDSIPVDMCGADTGFDPLSEVGT
jgi:hypothetical protein